MGRGNQILHARPSHANLHENGRDPPQAAHAARIEPDQSFLHEGLAYEHVVTTAGFDRAYSIMYHLRPPTRVKRG